MRNISVFLRNFLLRLILVAASILLTVYFFYRFTFINLSPFIAIFSIILFIAELHTVFHLYGMFYALWPRKYHRYTKKYLNKNLQLNIFICICGEPAEVVRQTIISAKNAADLYNKTIKPKNKARVVVLNDGKVAKKDNWKDIYRIAKELKVLHIARSKPGGFKAGNINNGLIRTKAGNPHETLDIILDADFSVKERFLFEIIKPFKDNSVDFAQSPQRYKNETSWVAKASAAHQIFFFDYICDSKAHDNALFLCGTNFAIRRSALESIGGMDTRFITEDFATSLELHLIGKKGVFIPEVLAEGIAPSTLKAYFSQQQRWSKGSFDVSFSYLRQILFGPLTLRQKFHYLLSATYYLIGMRDLLLMLAPLPYLFFGVSLIRANTWEFLLFVYAPLIVSNFIMYVFLFKHPIKSLVLDIASFPVFVAAFLSSLFRKELTFIVTIKKYEKENPFAVYKLQLAVVFLLVLGLIYGFSRAVTHGGAILNYFWATFDVLFLLVGFYLIIRENYNTSFLETPIFTIRRLLTFVPKSPRIIFSRTMSMFLLIGLILYSFLPIALIKTATIALDLPAYETEELLVPSNGVYYGYYQPSLNSHPLDPKTTVVDGERPTLAMFYQDWAPKNKFDANFLYGLSITGTLPIITWEPWDTSKKLTITPQQIINGKYDPFIRQWAKDSAKYHQPFFLRFAHEMNGDWYPWGKQSPQTYIAMWHHVHDIFEEENATNVIWVWSPNNTDKDGNTSSILSYYPGDAYVDWVGFSGFNWGTTTNKTSWLNFKELATDVYVILSKLNKPVMIAETSSVSLGGNKQEWFKDMLSNLQNFPQIKAVVLFDEKIQKADFSLKSGENFQTIVNENINANPYFLKTLLMK